MISPAIWLGSYELGVPTSVMPVAGPFHAALLAAAAAAPGNPALDVWGHVWSYADLESLSGRVAAALLSDGLDPGDRVLVGLPPCTELVAACLGTLRAGGVVAPVDPGQGAAGVQLAVARAAPRLAIVAPDLAPAVIAALDATRAAVVVADPARSLPLTLRILRSLVRIGRSSPPRPRDAVGWSAWLAPNAPGNLPSVSGDDPAVLIAPIGPGDRGQCFTHRQLVAGAAQLAAWLTDAVPGEDTWVLLKPLWQSFGFVAGLGTAVSLRARLVLLPGADGAAVLEVLRYRRPSFVAAGRATVAALAADVRLAEANFHPVRAWLVDEPLPPSMAQAFGDVAGSALCQGFGPAGVAGLATCNPVNGQRAPGSVGLPMPDVQVRLVGSDGEPVAPGSMGEMALCGPNVAGDNWLATGVRARVDRQGFIYLPGAVV
jgi:long-chain acyl-CoA synthetase